MEVLWRVRVEKKEGCVWTSVAAFLSCSACQTSDTNPITQMDFMLLL